MSKDEIIEEVCFRLENDKNLDPEDALHDVMRGLDFGEIVELLEDLGDYSIIEGIRDELEQKMIDELEEVPEVIERRKELEGDWDW